MRTGVLITEEPGKYSWGRGPGGSEAIAVHELADQPGKYVVVYRLQDGGIDLEPAFEAVRREEVYARGWGNDRQKPEGKKDHFRDVKTGMPYRPMDWIAFAEKYIADAKLAWANYTPDERAVTVRLLKAAYLLLAAISTNHTPEEIATLGGYSSSRFPIHHGGLQAMKEAIAEEKARA